MPDRRGGRPSQVRPRPPSTGRPAPAKPRTRASSSGRVTSHRRIERRSGLPLLTRLLLVLAVAALGITVLMSATGGLGRLVSAVGATVDGMIDDLTATPTPRPSLPVVADSPLIVAPPEPYTNQPAVDLVVNLPANVVGDQASVVRLYLGLEGQAAAPIQEISVGSAPALVVPGVTLTPGRNDFSATIRGPAGESESSPVVTYILDQDPPPIELGSPADGQTINHPTVTLSGRTQPRSELTARNEANAASATGQAGADGAFELVVPLATGANGIALGATDPAGNANQVVLSVLRGTGRLTAELSMDPARFKVARLPSPLELAVAVTDPDGRALAGAEVTFTLSIPGIQVVTSQATTGPDGRAVFATTVPQGATPGQGLGAILVRTVDFGEASDSIVLEVVE